MASKHSKWRASERGALFSLSRSSASLRRTPSLFAPCHAKVEMDGNGERREREMVSRVSLPSPLSFSRAENERAKVSLIIAVAADATGSQLPACPPAPLVVLWQLWWSFVLLSVHFERRETRIIMY